MLMEEKKNKKYPLWVVVIIRFFEVMFAIGLILLLLVLWCDGWFSYNVKGNITVNGEVVIPENIVCYAGKHEPEYQKTKIKYGDDYVYIKAKAFPYANYYFEFDVETEDGPKRFMFAVFKTHDAGPCKVFDYELNLCKEDDEWVAYVSLGNEYGAGEEERMSLKYDPNAFIQTGP